MGLIAYTGPNKFYSLGFRDPKGKSQGKPICFDKGIPTWTATPLSDQAPRKFFKQIRTPEDLAPFLGNKGRPIVITLPTREWMVFASIKFVNKMREYFPCNPIIVIAKKEFFPLIPDFCKKSTGMNVSSLKAYREFNFKGIKESQHFGKLMLVIRCLEDAFFAQTGMVDPGNPDGGPIIRPRLQKFGNTIAILADLEGDHRNSYWNELSDALLEQGIGPFQYEAIHGDAKTEEEMKTAVTALTSATAVISCGDSPLFPLPLYHGIPTFTFLPKGFDKVLFNQYKKYYGDFFFPAIIGQMSVKELLPILSQKIQSIVLTQESSGIPPIDMQINAQLEAATKAIIETPEEELEPVSFETLEDDEDEQEAYDRSVVGSEDGDSREEV